MTLSRREFVQVAAAMGASLAWGGTAKASRTNWREASQFYPEGVAFKTFDVWDEDFVGPNFIACLNSRADLIEALRCEVL